MTAATEVKVEVKVEPAAPMTPELKQKIVHQMEYYFGDVNLQRDKFMKEKLAENPDGWVNLDVFVTFNKIKAMTADISVICDAIKTVGSGDENILQVSEDNLKVKRKVLFVEMTDEQKKELNERTIHFKGIAKDASIESIRAFAGQYGKVLSVEMRRYPNTKEFKGCCMVVYATKEEANKSLAADDAYPGMDETKRENKIGYAERKKKMFEERRKNNKKGTGKSEETDKKEEEDDGADPVKRKGCVLKMDSITGTPQFSAIKDFFKHHGRCEYVDIDKEAATGFVRFADAEEAPKVLQTLGLEEGSTSLAVDKVEGATFNVSVLSGEDELAYWVKANEDRKKMPQRDHNRSRGKGFRRGGGYKGNHGKRSLNEGGNDNKKVKVEA